MKKIIKFIPYLFIVLIVGIGVFFIRFNDEEKKLEYELQLYCENLFLKKGSTVALDSKLVPRNDDFNIIWKSSNNDILLIEDGVVTALNLGNAIVTAEVENSDITNSCQINVVEDVIDVSEIKLNKENISLIEGAEYMLVATILPENATNQQIIWSSSDEDIASVDNGVVTAVNFGNAVITATTVDRKLSVDCIVNVEKKKDEVIEVEELILDSNNFSLTVGEIKKINAIVSPSNASNKEIIWNSSNQNIVIVNNGEIVAIEEGTAVITATTSDGKKSSSCNVSVIKKKDDEVIDKEVVDEEIVDKKINVSTINLNFTSFILNAGESKNIVATILPSNATNKQIIWSSSNESIAKVNNGVVTAVGEGNVVITAIAVDGNKKATCKVTVKKKNNVDTVEKEVNVKEISLNTNSFTLNVGENKNIIATISPNNATNKQIIWSSSNEDIVKVSNGVVTAIGEGNAIITATTVDGNKKATCNVNVIGNDRIHFIGNGTSFETFINQNNASGTGPSPSAVIVLESNGKFALVDTGLSNNDSLNPGRAQYVVNYLKKIGVKELEFIIITHVHYDHMGGATYILDNIPTKKLYTKVYYANDSASKDTKNNNLNRYNTLYNKTVSMGIFEKINANSEGKILKLGDMDVQLFGTKNLQYYEACYNEDENINSIITYVTVNNKKILLTGDVEPTTNLCLKKFNSSCSGTSILECIIKNNNIKNIDLLKLPHHGYSSCDINDTIINSLDTKYITIDNWSKKVNYYYKGITNNSGKTVGPVYGGLKSCRAKYFLDYDTSGTNRRAYYVNNYNFVFDFTNSEINIFNN